MAPLLGTTGQLQGFPEPPQGGEPVVTGLSAHCPATVRWGRFAGHLSMHSYSLTLGRLRLTEAKVNNPNKNPDTG